MRISCYGYLSLSINLSNEGIQLDTRLWIYIFYHLNFLMCVCVQEMFDYADKDNDGKISYQEFQVETSVPIWNYDSQAAQPTNRRTLGFIGKLDF